MFFRWLSSAGRLFPLTIVVAIVVAMSPLPVGAAPQGVDFSAGGEVECYDVFEVTLKVARADAANPFTDVVVEGEFARDGAKPLRVEGFCDAADGSVFRIRFMPRQPGQHRYSVRYRQGAYEATHAGTFAVRKGTRRGPVRVDPEYPWHFLWEGSGEHYFWNGTTAYFLAGWDDATIAKNVDRLYDLKVNRVRSALCGRVKDGQAWFEHVYPTKQFSFLLNPWVAKNPQSVEDPGFDVTRFAVAFWQKYERMLRHARDKDIVISVVFYVDGRRPGVDPFGKRGMGGVDEQRYYRYAVARLAALSNVMWDISNEYRLFRDDAWAEKMGALVKQFDPYDHLTSVHGHGDFRFRTSAWADFAMFQSWDEHGGYAYMLKNREEQAKTGRIMPQVNEEYGYEEHYPQGWGENRKSPARSADNRRRLAWEMSMAGAYQTAGERADRGTGWGADTGGGWINGRGNDSMTQFKGYGFLYDFFTSIPYWKLRPAPEAILAARCAPVYGKQRSVVASRTDDANLVVVYFPAGGTASLGPEFTDDGYKPRWYSPRDGGYQVALMAPGGTFQTPDDQDWLLVLRRSCCGL